MPSTDSSYVVPPFPAFPSTSRYVPLGSVQESLGRVCRSIEARDAISLVVGPPGTGKTLICRLLAEHYRNSHSVVVLGETPIENQAAFLRHLLHHLGVDIASIPDGDLQLALINQVCGKEAPEGGLLIVVDEAQSLSPEVMEAIRMVTNIMREGKPRVLAVVCGGVKLDEVLVQPSMEAFTQRVATRCYLHALNGEETRRYVTETIRNCGADPDETITAEAIAAAHHACSGVPRLINQMLTQAIDCAEEADQALITDKVMDQAWAELQQLPSPMVEEPKLARGDSPVEFGELDDVVHFGELSPLDEKQGGAFQSSPGKTGQCEPGECETGQCDPGRCEQNDARAESSMNLPSEQDESALGDSAQADIEVVTSTAQWVEEPEDQATRATQTEMESASAVSPSELFGHFEEEEELAVGNGFAAQARPATTAPPADLESMLHQEIVAINPFNSIEQSQPNAETDGPARESDGCDVDEEPQEQVNDFITVDDDPADGSDRSANPVLWISEPAGETHGLRLADDRDILVIEDEIELERTDNVARVDAQDQTISVDFQAMLNRMRTGR